VSPTTLTLRPPPVSAGTYNNLPLNTRPRRADLNDTGTQKFALRFNESFVLRSENINKYLATRGTNWQSDLYLVDDVSLAEKFTVLPVQKHIKPKYMPLSDNNNINEISNYVQNGSECHLLNTQLNYVQKVPGIDQIVTQGPGTRKKGMWRNGDVFQIHLKKMLEG